jgi:hypothetical protein
LRRQGVILNGPEIVLPAACTEPVSGGGSVSVVPEIVTGPLTWLPLNSTAVVARQVDGPRLRVAGARARGRVAADQHEAGAAGDRQRAGERAPADPHRGRGGARWFGDACGAAGVSRRPWSASAFSVNAFSFSGWTSGVAPSRLSGSVPSTACHAPAPGRSVRALVAAVEDALVAGSDTATSASAVVANVFAHAFRRAGVRTSVVI